MKALVEYKSEVFENPVLTVVEASDLEGIITKVCTEQSLTEDKIRILSKEETIQEITDFLALEFKSLVELGAEGKIEEYSLRIVNRWVGHLAEIVEQ